MKMVLKHFFVFARKIYTIAYHSYTIIQFNIPSAGKEKTLKGLKEETSPTVHWGLTITKTLKKIINFVFILHPFSPPPVLIAPHCSSFPSLSCHACISLSNQDFQHKVVNCFSP